MMSAMNAVVPHDTEAKAGSLANHTQSPQVGTWQWDIPGRAFTVDPAWCAALRLDACVGPVQAASPDSFERWARRIHPDDVGEFRRRLEATRLGKVERFDLEYRVLVGETVWIWLLQRGRVVATGSDGLPARVSGICLEIDDRKRSRKTRLGWQPLYGAHARPSGSGTSQPTSP